MTRFATTEYTDYTSPKCHAFTRITEDLTAHTAFTAAELTAPNESGLQPAPVRQRQRAERSLRPRRA